MLKQKQSVFQQTAYWMKIISLGVVLGLSIQFVQAWTAPTGTPPAGNVGGPLTTGAINQIKSAGLGLIGNLVANMVQLNAVVIEGSVCPSNGLVARDANGMLLSCQSLVWRKASGGGLNGTAGLLAPIVGAEASCATPSYPTNGFAFKAYARINADATVSTRVTAVHNGGCDSGWVNGSRASCRAGAVTDVATYEMGAYPTRVVGTQGGSPSMLQPPTGGCSANFPQN